MPSHPVQPSQAPKRMLSHSGLCLPHPLNSTSQTWQRRLLQSFGARLQLAAPRVLLMVVLPHHVMVRLAVAAQCGEGASAAVRQDAPDPFPSPPQATPQGPSGDPTTGRRTVRQAPFTRPGRPSQAGADKATGLGPAHEPAQRAAVPTWDLCAFVLSNVLEYVYSLLPLYIFEALFSCASLMVRAQCTCPSFTSCIFQTS